jgi:GDP-L-fucose synthase
MFPLGFGLDSQIEPGQKETLRAVLVKLGITADHVTLWGSGEPFREFLYVDDLAEACRFLMEKYDYSDIGEFINIGSGKDKKIKDMAIIVKRVIGYDGEIIYDTTKPDGTPRKLMDNSRLKKLGWQQTIDLEEGIGKEFEWYLSD